MANQKKWVKAPATAPDVALSTSAFVKQITNDPIGGAMIAGRKPTQRYSVDLHMIFLTCTSYTIKVSRLSKPVVADAALGPVDLPTSSQADDINMGATGVAYPGNASLANPIVEHVYTHGAGTWDDVLFFECDDSPAELYVSVKAAGTIGATDEVRSHVRS